MILVLDDSRMDKENFRTIYLKGVIPGIFYDLIRIKGLMNGMSKTMLLEIENSLNELENVRKAIRIFCSKIETFSRDDNRIDMIELGIQEILVNIIKHAYEGEIGKKIQISARVDTWQIKFELFDKGVFFNPEIVSSPQFDGSRDSGFGVYIANQIFDEIEYLQNKNKENHTILTFGIGGE